MGQIALGNIFWRRQLLLVGSTAAFVVCSLSMHLLVDRPELDAILESHECQNTIPITSIFSIKSVEIEFEVPSYHRTLCKATITLG
jgi:hypothetical protein